MGRRRGTTRERPRRFRWPAITPPRPGAPPPPLWFRLAGMAGLRAAGAVLILALLLRALMKVG